MMRKLSSLLAISSALACTDPAAPGQVPDVLTTLPRQLTGAEQAIVSSTPGFGFGLLRQVNTTWADSNVFLSPLSASMALGMTMNGAAGSTFDEMRTTLGLPDRPLAELNAGYKSLMTLLRSLDRTVDMRIGNSIWMEQRFAPQVSRTFQDDLKTFFEASSTGLDFASPTAITTINNWVKTSTNGKIDKILERIPPEMVMYLINAIYFKGAWREPFDPAATAPGAFTAITGQRVTVPMMTRKGKFRAAVVNGVQMVELPYGSDAFVMTIAMPPEGQSVNTFIAGLTPASWQALTATLGPSTTDLYLPKFSLSWSDKLNDELQGMGMRRPFVPGGADFTRMSPSVGRELYISDVRQRAIVEVNEAGTVAAAVTSVGVGVTSLPVSIRIDRPFVFAIRERLSGTLLFMGKLARPVV
jgi:serine protease inhibitor